MIFNSIDEVTAYVNVMIASSMPEVGDNIKKVMDDVTRRQVKGYSKDIFKSVVSNSSFNTAEATFEDTGGWTSLITGEEVGNPIGFLEAGTTWNTGASNIMESSHSICESKIPEKLRSLLLSKGVPIE